MLRCSVYVEAPFMFVSYVYIQVCLVSSVVSVHSLCYCCSRRGLEGGVGRRRCHNSSGGTSGSFKSQVAPLPNPLPHQ